MSFRFFFLVISTCLLGFYLRASYLGEVPRSLYWDEVAMLIDARSIAQTGKDMHQNTWFSAMFLSYGDYKLPVYIWLSALFGLVTNSDMMVRLPNIILGTIGLLATSFLALDLVEMRKKASKKYLFFAVLFAQAVAPWAILFSRTGFEAFASQFFVTLSIFSLSLSRKKPFLLILTPLLGALATYTYFATRFVWPVVVIAFWLLYKKHDSKSIIALLLVLGVFFTALTPLYRSQYYAPSQQFRLSTPSLLDPTERVLESNAYATILSNSILGRGLFHRHIFFARELGKNISDHLSFKYLFITSQTDNLRHSTGLHGLFLWSMAPFFIIGLYKLATTQKKLGLFLGIWWLAALIPASIPLETPHALRSLNALTPLILCIGYGLAITLQKFDTIKLLQFAIIGVLCAHTAVFFWHYTIVYPKTSASSWQEHAYTKAVQVLGDREGKEPLIVERNDGLLYLWFLAYGDYSPVEIQNFAKNEYHQLSEFDGIRFE